MDLPFISLPAALFLQSGRTCRRNCRWARLFLFSTDWTCPSSPCPQYSVYIFAGLTGVAGALLTRRACNRGTSVRLPVLVLVVAAAAVLASLGLGIYQVKGAAFVLFRSSCCLGRRVRRLPHLVAATCCCLFAHSSPGNQTLPPSNAAEQERGAAQPLVVLPAVRTGELTTC